MMRDNTVVAYVDKDPDGYRAVAAVCVCCLGTSATAYAMYVGLADLQF